MELSGPAVTTETVEESAPVTGQEPSQAEQSRLERDREEGEQEEVVQKVLQEDEREAGTEGGNLCPVLNSSLDYRGSG